MQNNGLNLVRNVFVEPIADDIKYIEDRHIIVFDRVRAKAFHLYRLHQFIQRAGASFLGRRPMTRFFKRSLEFGEVLGLDSFGASFRWKRALKLENIDLVKSNGFQRWEFCSQGLLERMDCLGGVNIDSKGLPLQLAVSIQTSKEYLKLAVCHRGRTRRGRRWVVVV